VSILLIGLNHRTAPVEIREQIAFSREGVATALLRRVMEEAARFGIRRTMLEVRRSNTAAQELYERFGFVVAGTRSNYYTNPVEDALVLWREERV
jgi:ribosomal-protein-alanine N-acetyltransferase